MLMNRKNRKMSWRIWTQTARQVFFRKRSCALLRRGGFGLNEVIGIAAGIIIALVVIIPGLRAFAGEVVDQLSDWWDSLSAGIFN